MKKRSLGIILMPLIISISIVIGILLGEGLNRVSPISSGQGKLSTIIGLINKDYVDTIDIDSIIEMALPNLLSGLDPHSSYIGRADFKAVNDDLEGSFSGVGISFQIIGDTVTIVEVITGGPAEKVGLRAGDRIVTVNGNSLTGEDVTNEDVFKSLRGDMNTKVKLGIKRYNSTKVIEYDIIRGDIPVNSVDAYYMLDNKVGYVKVGKFARNTYNEFMNALLSLKTKGATKYIVDLRDNSGGFMDQAIFMVNEFLPEGKMIVYTKGRTVENETFAVSDGSGTFQKEEIVVLMNEYSASASEIFAGAIQDNDRGVIVGRRSFGKGLVQNQTILPDSSAIRLTVARYYIPSGRSIQKDYKRGKDGKYQQEIVERYSHGEFYNADSIKQDKSKVFYTMNGREVYGGGGIMPDVFVPNDTTGITSYYINVVNAGLIQKFAFDVVDHYRLMFGNLTTAEEILNVVPREDTLLQNFVNYASKNNIPARWYYINQSRELLLRQIKAMIVRDVLGYNEFYRVFYKNDNTINSAHDIIQTDEYNRILNDIISQ